MIESLPLYIPAVFIATTALTVFLFFKAAHYSKVVIGIICLWLFIQGIAGYTQFYTVTDAMPPRFLMLVLPPLALIITLFLTKPGKDFVDRIDLQMLTWLHVVRIPVELVLLWLFQHGQVPQLMTFEGRNFDIFSGLTAPLIVYFGFIRKTLSSKVILLWNVVCLGLLVNIVANAVLSAPFPFQKFAFDQPNVGVLYFPFVWLPGLIVPLVLFAHLAAFRGLAKKSLY